MTTASDAATGAPSTPGADPGDAIEGALRDLLGLPQPFPVEDPGACEAALRGHPAPRLGAAMAWSTLAGGKRLRPRLVLAAAEACGAEPASALIPACAVELLHTYSLVHDDLPDMDDDDLRRGRATCHRAYDPATAILAGDALQSLAYQALASAPGLPPERRAAMVTALADASGTAGMAGGQMRDLRPEPAADPLEALATTHRMKTGALFRASARIGGLCAPRIDDARLAALDRYADRLGLAFQVVDDLLDGTVDTAVLGKPAGSDARRDLDTYLTLMGEAEARDYARRLHREACEALQVPGLEPGPLVALAHRIADRVA